MLLHGWSDRVTLFTNGPAELEPADTERLQEAGIPVDERRIGELRGNDSDLAAIVFADGSQAPCEGLLVAPTLSQRSQLAKDLGLKTTEDHPMVANAIEVDSAYCTSVENVFAAGDATGGIALSRKLRSQAGPPLPPTSSTASSRHRVYITTLIEHWFRIYLGGIDAAWSAPTSTHPARSSARFHALAGDDQPAPHLLA